LTSDVPAGTTVEYHLAGFKNPTSIFSGGTNRLLDILVFTYANGKRTYTASVTFDLETTIAETVVDPVICDETDINLLGVSTVHT